jgi:hypothetical protein
MVKPLRVVWLILSVLTAIAALPAGEAQAAPQTTITLTSIPPGATVYIDGKEKGARGQSGDAFKVKLTRGTHKVLLELEGYKPMEQTIQVGPTAQRMVFTLERAPARLTVRAPAASDDAQGGELFIDGVNVGTVPREVEVTPGQHLVEVRKPGYKIFSETVEVRAAEVKALLVTLRAEIKRGSLLILAVGGEGVVYVDGQNKGQAPAVVDGLDEGEHTVEIRKAEGEAPIWQGRARVQAGQQTQVRAEVKQEPKTGSLLVLAPADAEVIIDGTTQARPNQEIPDLKPGQHVIQVQGKGYRPVTKIVEIEVGKQRAEKVELQQTDEARGVASLRVIMVNPIEGAQYFVNGRRVREEDVTSDKGMEVTAGPSVVVVQREGFGKVTKMVNIAAGAREAVTVELRNVGRLVVTSTPPGAQVWINGSQVGQTPYTGEDVPGGQHMVEVRLHNHQVYQQQVTVRAGEQSTVSAALQEAPAAAPVPVTPPHMQASFSAVPHDPGRFSVDVSVGYPYFIGSSLVVGAWRRGMFGLDAGVDVRTAFYLTEAMVRARAQLFQAGPIAGGLNLAIGGGGGPRGRNTFTFEIGAPLTLMAGRLVMLTARPYLQVYSDQLCPTPQAASVAEFLPEHDGDRCTGASGMFPDATLAARTGTYDPTDARYQEAGTGVLDRFTRARFFLQAVLEVEVTRVFNLWLLFETAPGQERQAFTDKFGQIFPTSDVGVYGRVGATFKF